MIPFWHLHRKCNCVKWLDNSLVPCGSKEAVYLMVKSVCFRVGVTALKSLPPLFIHCVTLTSISFLEINTS